MESQTSKPCAEATARAAATACVETTASAASRAVQHGSGIARPLLCLVTDRKICRLPFFEAAAQAIEAGVDWIQVRERDLTAHDLCELAKDLQALAQKSTAHRNLDTAAKTRVKILINRRLDVALALGTDGVHLGWNALAPREARSLWQSLLPHKHDALVGCAAHSLADVHRAAASGADYVHLAPIFPPRSKSAQSPPLGLAALEEASRVGIPVIAQGGITPQNARAAIEAGASGIAVTGEILLSETPHAVCRALRAALDAAKPRTPLRSATQG